MFHRPVELPPEIGQVPIVLANCFDVERTYTSVVPHEFSGGYAAAHRLLTAGHRKIGFINLGTPDTGRPPTAAATGRLAGFKQALEEFDVPYDENLIRYTNQSPQANYQLAMELLQMPSPPTAIFCGNDRTALGVYGACSHLGLRIPQDIAVIGFDNHKDIVESLWPPLTTVQLPHYEMGQWAVEYLMSPRVGTEPPVQHEIICELVERESV
jgi:LacI family transcriptional regulator